MDEELRNLVIRKVDAIVRAADADLSASMGEAWKEVGAGAQCPWVGDLMRAVQSHCYRSVAERGNRVAAVLKETLESVKPLYDETLASDLKAIVNPHFPEDVCLAPAISTRGVYLRRNPQKFDEETYEQALTLVRVAVANAARDAKQKVHFVIEDYALSVKRASSGNWRHRLWEALSLRPGAFGFGIDLKKLFERRMSRRE